MKKLFLFFTGLWFAASSVQAAETAGIFQTIRLRLPPR